MDLELKAETYPLFAENTQGMSWMEQGGVPIEEALKESKLNFDIEMRKAAFANKQGVWEASDPDRFMVRTDTDKPVGRAKSTYHPMQNHDVADVLSKVFEKAGYDAPPVLYAAPFKDGARVMMGFKLPHEFEITTPGGEKHGHSSMVQALWGHDGMTGVALNGCDMRASCWNMAPNIYNGGHSIKHTEGGFSRMYNAVRGLLTMPRDTTLFAEDLQALANRHLSLQEFRSVVTFMLMNKSLKNLQEPTVKGVTKVINAEYKVREEEGKNTTELENKIGELEEFFKHGSEGAGENAYSGYQAITAWIDRKKARKATADQISKSLESSVSGQGLRRKKLGFQLLKKISTS